MEVMQISPFAKALSALADASLQPCLMRADGDPATWTGELDLIILPAKVHTTLQVLHSLGWETKNTGFFDPSRRHLLLWSDGRFLKIDLYTKIVSAGLEYIDAKLYLTGASLQGNVYVPRPGNWLLHIIVNTILEKQSLREEYRPRLASALQNPDTLWEVTAEAKRLGVGYLFESDPALNFLFDQTRIAALRPGVRRALLRARPINRARLTWRSMMQTVGKKLGLRPGFSIAVIGPDGAGKTTFLTTLGAMLNRIGIETGTVYFGPWERTVLASSQALRRLGADPLDIGKDSPARKTKLKLLKAHVRRVLYYANFLPEMWARYAVRVWPLILERHVMLLDRHAVDLEVGYYNQPMTNFAWLRFLLARLSPRPRMFILLDNDAEVIWQRKKEFSLALIESSLSRYRKVAPEYGMIVIKTDRPAEELVNELIDQHWRDFVRLRRDGLPMVRRV
jgi:thymidylate kinase